MISFDKFFDLTPKTEYFPEFDTEGVAEGTDLSGIKALTFEGADYKGQKTKVFAHVGFPENADSPVPAVVLVHGGGGHPEDKWIKQWTKRGFAAIAMDVTGYFPTEKIPCIYEGFAAGLKRELTPPFREEGYTVSPDNVCMSDADEDVQNQWMYHAVASTLLAHNVLRNDPRIDNTKIGLCGISWGGIITATAIGYDSRFAFAIPIYGAGFPRENLSYMKELYASEKLDKWLPENRFSQVKMPVMWLCWNDDCNFSVNSNSLSFLATRDSNPLTCLSMLHNMRHSHLEGYTPEESYWFARAVISNRSVPRVSVKYSGNTAEYFCDGELKAVRLFYITEKMSYTLREKHRDKNFYMAQEWSILDLSPDENKAIVPTDAVGRYIEFTLKDGIILTSPYEEISSGGAI